MVKNALKSILNQTYQNYDVFFVNDSDEHDVMAASLAEFNFPPEKLTYCLSNESDQLKAERGYSRLGYFWNDACEKTDADVAIMLCDDDALHPDYLMNMKNWYEANPDQNYCYSHAIPFDPFTQNFEEVQPTPFWLNHTHPLAPSCMVDASQVSWRVKPMVEAGIKFPETQTRNLDAGLYAGMYDNWGLCNFSGFYGQYKGTYSTTLTNRGSDFGSFDLP